MVKKLDIGQKAKVCVQWNVKPVDYSREKANDIAAKMAAKYNIPRKNVVVEANFVKKNAEGQNVIATADIVQNIQDPKFQQDLFKAYMEENEITECDFDLLVSIDNQLNSLIDYSQYDKFRRYKVEWVRWSNFLSYGPDNFVDFNDLEGLVLLKSEPANQGGKTNFACDLIEFLLFGSIGSGKADVLKKIFNNHLPDATEVKVEGGIEIDGEHYVIKRTLTRPQRKKRTSKSNVTQKVEYFRVVDGTEEMLEDVENLEAENNTQTNKVIKEAIGNKKDFNLVVLANSKNLSELISMKDAERGRLLYRWIGLLPLEEKDQKAREKWNKEIAPSLLSSKYNKEQLKDDIRQLQEAIESTETLVSNTELKKEESVQKLASMSTEREDLYKLKRNVNPELSRLDVQTLENTLERLKNEGVILVHQLEEVEQKLQEIGEVSYSEDEYREYTAQKDNLVNVIAQIKADIFSLRNINKSLADAEYCPTCGQRLVGVDNQATINSNNALIEQYVNTGVTRADELKAVKAKLEELEDARTKFNSKNVLEVKRSTLNLEIERKRHEYTTVKNTLTELNNNKAAIEHNNLIDTKLNVLYANIATEERVKDSFIADIEGYKKDIDSWRKSISEREIIIGKINEEEGLIRTWKLYLDMVGKNGICKMVLRNTLPIINAEMKRLLFDVCDFDVEVNIDDRNDITFNIIADGVSSDLSSGSGFEQTVASLALRAVLGNISTMSRPSFMLLDEVLGGVAKVNYDNIKKLYDRMLKDYSFIFQVTHLEDITDWHDTTVVVKKENRVSSISVLK